MDMGTRQYLCQMQRLDKQIQNKLAEIYKLRTMAIGISVATDKEKIQTSSDKDKIGNFVAKIIDMEHEVDNMIDKRATIVSQIEEMEDIESYDILANVYILGKDLKVVAVEKKLSYRHFLRLYNKAVFEFEENYKNVTECH